MQVLQKNTQNTLDKEKNKYVHVVRTSYSRELVTEEYKNKENKIFWANKTVLLSGEDFGGRGTR